MLAKRVSAQAFAQFLVEQYQQGAGYIMGSYGQNPKKWAVNSWWFNQYKDNPKQYKQALYWREHSLRVFDCQGLSEGYYLDQTGVDVNTKARYNYAQWCDPKGKGTIPAMYRVPGAAVFWGTSAANIHHVGYLVSPVDMDNVAGDWYIIEARGVMYGVVKTKLYSRKPDFWGWMTRYFDYDQPAIAPDPDEPRDLRNGDEGEDVKEMQTNLIRLGYDCGKWGADGDFGDATEIALKKFQEAHGLNPDGVYGSHSREVMERALADYEKPQADPRKVKIVGGNCYVRSAPNTSGRILGVAHEGESYNYGGMTTENGWHLIDYKGQNGMVSGKYSRLMG